MTNIQYINTPEQLARLCVQIKKEPWLALDTEFLREKTYYPKFCLLQIATPEWVACIDPIALPSLDMLFEVIYSPDIIKVFHSSRQDLEIFYQLTGKLPEPLFDTQLLDLCRFQRCRQFHHFVTKQRLVHSTIRFGRRHAACILRGRFGFDGRWHDPLL